jgi:PAS domain S-box-containing protein
MDQLSQILHNRALQQEAVAQLGQSALAGGSMDSLFQDAVHAGGRILQVEHCEILELLPENILVMRTTLDDGRELIGSRFETGTSSLSGYALQRREPVLMADIRTETRFTPHPVTWAQGVVCGVSVVIHGRERPYGVLNALSTRHRTFVDHDVHFLRALANILGAAIDRFQTEAALHRSEQEAKRLAAEESVLAEIGRIISSSRDIGEVYERFASAVTRVLPYDRISINLLDGDCDHLVIRHSAGGSVPGRDPGDGMPSTGTATEAVIRTRAGLLVQPESLESLARLYPLHIPAYRAGYRSSLFAPLVSEGRAFGALVLMSRTEHRYGPKEVALAESVASQVSGAIAHAQLLEEHIRSAAALRASELTAQRMIREKAVLAEVARILSSTLKIEDVYERFSEEAHRVLAFDRITITRVLPEKGAVQILYTSGPPVAERALMGEYPLSGTISGDVVRTRKGLAFCPADEAELRDAYPNILPMWAAEFRSFLLAPLVQRDRVTGTLVLSSRETGAYGPDDLALAESIAFQIGGAIANARLFAEHRQMADALRESEASLLSIFRAAPVGIGLVRDRVIVQVNRRVCDLLGYEPDELVGQSARVFYATEADFDFVGREKYRLIRETGTGAVETRWRRKNGVLLDVLLTSTPVDPSDPSRGMTFTVLDITPRKEAEQERRRLEERLRQAQKMEAIGTLAGGIAHDFNNILAAIIGFSELATIATDRNSEARGHLAEVLKASFRARDLVRQILTFSRRTESEFAPVNVHLIVGEALKLLRASLPSTIDLRHSTRSRGRVLGDPTQIHQVVMNLCTNAYQAMPRGGTLEVTLSETRIDPMPPPEPQILAPGPYLKLGIRDTGHGIDPSILHRIFDPYFTTKEKTKGTGLGLAVVHGIVKAHKGAVRVSSRVEEGTTFDVLLPLISNSAPGLLAREQPVPRGSEHILFVDDEPSIEALGRLTLEALGYQVTTSLNPADALARFRAAPRSFDLVITDMTMPGMTGDRLAQEVMRIRPDLPVVVCTGHSDLIDPDRARALGIQALVMKPILRDDLADLVRTLLDRAPLPAPPPTDPS